MMKYLWIYLFLPITRTEMPGRWTLLTTLIRLGYQHDHLWKDAPTRIIRGKWHGYKMALDLSDWSERITYFLGRYYEIHMQLLLNAILKPGDRMVDIGANIGMITLHAAHLVGSGGRVDSFEPNPQCVTALTDNVNRNNISHIHVNAMGLSDGDDVLALNLDHSHTGTATFADMNANEVVKSVSVPVKKGDHVFEGDNMPAKLIKIDVEGFELRVLKGMENTLRQWKSMVVIEVIHRHLQRAGTSFQEIEKFMAKMNYKPYIVSHQRRGFRQVLVLTPLLRFDNFETDCDVLWAIDDMLEGVKLSQIR